MENQSFYPSLGWWKVKEAIAKRMTLPELEFAYKDCLEAAKCLPCNESKYHDEASIYNRAIQARRKK